MIHLSVNLNKVATLRNSRGGDEPSVLAALRVCLAAGVQGITVHPRQDQRHIRNQDVRDIAAALSSSRETVEYNIEGDPRPDLLELALEVKPHQLTLVPVMPGEVTSSVGWSKERSEPALNNAITRAKAAGIRVSLFVAPRLEDIRFAKDAGADRIELYTEPFARAYAESAERGAEVFQSYAEAARYAHSLGLGINAGHDLDAHNLVLFRKLPHLAEVSIGHALISQALFDGLAATVKTYLDVLVGSP